MLRLMLPCRPSDESQLKAKIRILEECVGDKYSIGFEIVGKWDDFFDRKIIEKSRESLRQLPESIYLSLHAPYDVRGDWKRNFFSSKPGYLNLLTVLDLADSLGVKLVNLHASLFHSHDELKRLSAGDLGSYKNELIGRVGEILLAAHRQYPEQKICLENMPYAWDHDVTLNPEEMIYEICFVAMEDFLEIINPEANIFVTMDTCHLAVVCDSSQLLNEIKKLGKGLGCVHLNDLEGLWQPFISLAREGIIPGDGRIGKTVFKELIRYFLELSQNQELAILLEINDRDFAKPEESRESIKRVMAWLDELKKAV